jgi:hypothetical protein
MLLTEVGIDDKSLIMYDITGLYTEISTQIVATRIKCFKNENDADFFLILDTEDQIRNFNQTFLLTLLKYMKTQKADRLIICLRKDLTKSILRKTDRSLRFVGFRKLGKEYQKTITIGEFHSLYSFNIGEE